MIREPEEKEVWKFDPEDDNAFREYLNEISEPVQIFGITFEQGYILQHLDEIAFNTIRNDSNECEIVYICPECSTEHDDYDDAKWCCQEQPECPVCGISYDTEKEAQDCCAESEENNG